jgi:hypothetical protein
VPDRVRSISRDDEPFMEFDVLSLSWAADAEGRSKRRGATDPFTNDRISSLVVAEPTDEPFCDGAVSADVVLEVPALPLRFLNLYFSIASASRSSIRVAMGDNTLEGLRARFRLKEGEGTENPLVLLAELLCCPCEPADGSCDG